MKNLLPLVILSLSVGARAQVSQKVFFNKFGRKCDEQSAYVYQPTERPGLLKTPGLPTDDNDTLVTVYFAASDNICMTFTCIKGYHRGPYKLFYENGRVKEEGLKGKGGITGTVKRYYPNGSLHEVVNFRENEIKNKLSQYDELILDYRDSSGVQTVHDGNGFCDRYFFDADSSHVRREEGLLKNGLKDKEWSGYEDGVLSYKEQFSNGEFKEGECYEKGETIRYTEIERQPEYPGGLKALSKFISKNLRYPKDARRLRAGGKVFVQFVVLKDGTVDNVEILKSVYPSIDAEAMHVVRIMPHWIPGMQRGKAVKAKFVLPIYFKL